MLSIVRRRRRLTRKHSNAINGTNVYIIYAQTDKFSIAGEACTDPATTASASTCAAAATATVTVTVRGSNSTSPSVTGSAAPGLVTAGVKLASNSSAPTSTFAGTCPGTIGWSSDYAHPVTLTSTPDAGHPVATAFYPTGTFAAAAKPTHTGVGVPAPSGSSAGTSTLTPVVASSKSKGKCSSKKRSIKRHSDGGKKAPMLKRRN